MLRHHKPLTSSTLPPANVGLQPLPAGGGQVLFADEFTALNSSLWVPEIGDGSDYNIPGCVCNVGVMPGVGAVQCTS